MSAFATAEKIQEISISIEKSYLVISPLGKGAKYQNRIYYTTLDIGNSGWFRRLE